MNQKASHNSNYTYDADGQRSIKYVPEGLEAHYSAKDAGRKQHLATMLYPSPLLTVEALDLPTEDELPPDIDEPTLQALNHYHLTRYTKHYFIGSERLNSTIGSQKNLGVLCEPIYGTISAEIVMEMNNKVENAGSALTEDYTAFEKQANLDKPYLYSDNEYLTFCGEALPNRYAAFWFHPDHLGSSNYITDLNGNVSQHMEYFPFGETLVEEHKNSNNSPYKFNAKELDDETGNYYYGARYYNPKYVLWLSVDPSADKFIRWSPYNYSLQNPVKFIDPTGAIVTPADNAATRKYIAKIKKSPELRRIYKKLQKSNVRYHINVSSSFKEKDYGIVASDENFKGGYTTYSQKSNRINILVNNSSNTALNTAALGDEIKTAEQFDDYLFGFEKNSDFEHDSESLFYDPIDEIETKKAALMALQANGYTAQETDPNNEYQSTQILKAIESGITNNKQLIDRLLKTKYNRLFDTSKPYQNKNVPKNCKCVSPRYF